MKVNRLSILKTFTLVFIIIFAGGTIWSMINGYKFFCDGMKACDKYNTVLSWSEFKERQINSVLFTSVISMFITLMVFLHQKNGSDES